jgi:hypothetical protein
MNSKISILISSTEYTSFHSTWLEEVWKQHFNLILVDNETDTSYDKTRTLIVTNGLREPWYKKFSDNGFKVVVDNTWEAVGTSPRLEHCHTHVMEHKSWFWYNESIWYRQLGYHEYLPQKNQDKVALLAMNRPHPYRVDLRKALEPVADKIIMSAAWLNQYLPDDLDCTHGQWQRYFNPSWYDRTYFSIVTESNVTGPEVFVTEKTYKPLAFYHPFVVLGQPGILSLLRSQGFETFENLFDETYDSSADFAKRISQIVDLVTTANFKEYDSLTRKKIQHNHDLFFNQQRVMENLTRDIVDPILEFANA